MKYLKLFESESKVTQEMINILKDCLVNISDEWDLDIIPTNEWGSAVRVPMEKDNIKISISTKNKTHDLDTFLSTPEYLTTICKSYNEISNLINLLSESIKKSQIEFESIKMEIFDNYSTSDIEFWLKLKK